MERTNSDKRASARKQNGYRAWDGRLATRPKPLAHSIECRSVLKPRWNVLGHLSAISDLRSQVEIYPSTTLRGNVEKLRRSWKLPSGFSGVLTLYLNLWCSYSLS